MSKKNKDPFLGRVLYRFLSLIGLLPSWWHYFCSDLISLLLQYVIGYRREVIRTQLKNSFPEKSPRELKKLERKVYLNLCDIAVEIIMLCGFSRRRLRKHLTLEDQSIVLDLHAKGHHSIYMLLGHYGNWEWFTGLQDFIPESEFNVLYKKQHGVWDYVMRRARSKFGAKLIEKEMSGRTIIERRHDTTPRSYIFVADQTPGHSSIYLFVDFFHQPTATFTGMERLAKLTSAPVLYIDIFKERRGKYKIAVDVITENASQLEDGVLATNFMRRLEKTIRRAPEYWLWSHRRWKYSVESVTEEYPDRKILRM